VAREGEFVFVVHARELPYEPPHVHVEFGDEEVRINLDDGTFLDEPRPGKARRVMRAYRWHATRIREVWDRLHRSEEE
jgi:hypothetical protein